MYIYAEVCAAVVYMGASLCVRGSVHILVCRRQCDERVGAQVQVRCG